MTNRATGGFFPGPRNAITDVPGIRVGQVTDRRAGTGCTVILCERARFAACDTRGGAPGTRETGVLGPANLVRNCHAVLLTGGSAFGLDAAGGVMKFLSEAGVGFETGARKVPIVTGAVLYDLSLGKAAITPTDGDGYRAAKRARGGVVEQGSVGAGTGATVAKLLGQDHALKGGLGTASLVGPRGLVVGAVAAVNPTGIVVDPSTGRTLAGVRGTKGRFLPLATAIEQRTAEMDKLIENTTLVCVATNAGLEHHQVQRLAIQAHNGIARTILPAHAFGDGDVTFAISMATAETKPHDTTALGVMTTLAVEQAILNGVREATGLHGVPSAAEWAARE
jgi:L-aminopeptidase/D-esterase-like protein